MCVLVLARVNTHTHTEGWLRRIYTILGLECRIHQLSALFWSWLKVSKRLGSVSKVHKHEDLSSDPSTHSKKPGMFLKSQCWEGRDRRIPGYHWPVFLFTLVSSWCSERVWSIDSVIKNTGWSYRGIWVQVQFHSFPWNTYFLNTICWREKNFSFYIPGTIVKNMLTEHAKG